MSVYESLKSAIVGTIQGLPLNPQPKVRFFKRGDLLEGVTAGGNLQSGLTQPVVLVALNDGVSYQQTASAGRGKVLYLVRYPCTVAAAYRNRGQMGDQPILSGWFDIIWSSIVNYTNLNIQFQSTNPPPGSQINEVFADGVSLFDPSALNKGLDWATKHFRIETSEIR